MKVHIQGADSVRFHLFVDDDGPYDIPREVIRRYENAKRELAGVEMEILNRLGFENLDDVRADLLARDNHLERVRNAMHVMEHGPTTTTAYLPRSTSP